MIKIIYFDYHGVLDRRGYEGLMEAILRAARQPNSAVEKIRPYTYAYACGKIPPLDFWNAVERDYGRDGTVAGKKYYLHVDPIREMWELINELKNNYPLGLATDCAIDKKEVLKRAYDLPEFFDNLVFSCDAGLSKKEMDFYRLMQQDGTYRPEECLLIDENEHNVALARTMWFAAYQYVDTVSLKKYLASIG